MMGKLSLFIVLLISLVVNGCSKNDSQTIKVGGIWDLTGPTSDAAVLFTDGERDYISYVNSRGGINGRKIELIYDDYAYNILRAEALYHKLVHEDKVVAILGWGTGDSQILSKKAALDKIPFIPCSLTEDLSVVANAPYNFLMGPSYSDQMLVALKYIIDNPVDTTRKPKVAFFYNNTAFGLSPIKAGRDYASANGIDLVAEKIVDLSALDATEQIKSIMDAGGADYGIINQTSNGTATVIRSAYRLNSRMKLITLNWGVDEKVLALTGQAGEGVLGITPFSFPYENIPAMEEVRSAMPVLNRDINSVGRVYLQGWITAKVLLTAMARSGDNLSGEGIRQALEKLENFDTGEIVSPVTYNSKWHKGASLMKIYQIENGRWVRIKDRIEIIK
ncbi:MAG: ABC transporter substrate-binding protein [Candidatus Omnitrophota bacterium]